MEKKLRLRFVFISTMATLIAFIILISFVDFASKRFIVNLTGVVADIVIENDGEIPKEFDAPRRPGHLAPSGVFMEGEDYEEYLTNEIRYTTRFFTAEINPDNSINTSNFDNISSENIEVANEILQAVITTIDFTKADEILGYEGDYVYRAVKTEDGAKKMVFIDSQMQLQISDIITHVLTILCFIILVLVFILSCVFSKKAVSPIVDAQNKQKEFITNVSHELKTPLAIMKANTEVMEVIDGENEWTSSNHKQIERLNKLVSYLVSLTKFEEKKNEKLKLMFSLSDSVVEIAQEFKTITESQNKEIILNIEKNLSYAGDEESIRMMFSTLFENAVKYSKENTSIKVSLVKKANKNIFMIQNEADNLEIGDYSRLFERFHREDKARNSNANSFGIGLSIAKTIIENHKGSITAKSIDGKNIIFTIIL